MKEINEKKILFLTFEGIGSTIFTSQVAIHVNEMYKMKFNFDIITFETWRKQWKQSNVNLINHRCVFSNLSIILKRGINIYFPFLNLLNILIFSYSFIPQKNKYSMIHARSDYAAFISIVTKPLHKLPVIWDCRGDSLDELYFALKNKNVFFRFFGLFYLIPALKIRLYIINKFADKAIFVSNALKDHYSKILKTSKYVIIPCPVSDNIFYFDNELRIKKRNDLNFKTNQKVFLYSGSLVGYQFVEGLSQLFEKILSVPDNIILMLTSEPDEALKKFNYLLCEKFLILKAPFTEMVDFYNAADFAILIRKNRNLNFVASPTKFGEYCLTGLPVIMNNSIDQSYNIAIKLGNYVSYENIPNERFSITKREDIANESLKYFSRSVLNNLYIELYQ